jgi:hypothetical protein
MMKMYHVNGAIEWVEPCDCPDCDGHEEETRINEDIQADDAEQAAGLILDRIQSGLDDDTEASWSIGPFVTEITEEIHMRRIGAPELPLFEQVTA